VERKRLDDLCSSIIDGRFREQKVRHGAHCPRPLGGTSGWSPGRAPATPATSPLELVQGGLNSNPLGPLWAHSRCAGSLGGAEEHVKNPRGSSSCSPELTRLSSPGWGCRGCVSVLAAGLTPQ